MCKIQNIFQTFTDVKPRSTMQGKPALAGFLPRIILWENNTAVHTSKFNQWKELGESFSFEDAQNK